MFLVGWLVPFITSLASTLPCPYASDTRTETFVQAASFSSPSSFPGGDDCIAPATGPRSARGTRPAGSSLLQNSQNTVGTASAAALAAAASLSEAEAGASRRSYQGSMDPGLNDMVTAFIVVSLLLLISIIGFVILETSHKSRPDGEVPPTGPRSNAGMVDNPMIQSPRQPAEPLPRASMMMPQHQAPHSLVPTHSTSARMLSPDPNIFYLCGPELVVPDGKECNLVIPSIKYQTFIDGKINVLINDEKGSSILRGIIHKTREYDGTRILLKSRDGEQTWARCKDSGTKHRWSMHGKGIEREAWGWISMTPGGTVAVETATGHKVNFDGPPHGKVKVLDNFGVLMAVSEFDNRGRAVRVGPLVDVGFVMLCHLAQDLLMMEA